MTATRDRSFFNTPESIPLLLIEDLVNKNSSILIVAPHPDDETLGCGGAIALLRQLNIVVKVLVVSDGTKSHPNSKTYPPPTLKKLREQESLAALAVLGVAPEAVTFLGMPDGAVPSVNLNSNEIVEIDKGIGRQGDKETKERGQEYQDAISLCHQYLKNTTPSIVLLPWRRDPHPDHRASWQLFTAAIKNLINLPRLIEYPIWDWDTKQRQDFSESVDAWRLDISSVLELKRQAIAQYRSQISDLIDDDPEGFRLTPEMLLNFTQPWEIYLEVKL
ncbi:PIG-L deacetylase family protein [Pleurocapsa sp. FMAR1]|uniref:PIG-L deacetylase family protein n=1 Tax=Pleurocapsa sp. FMAR1 TaxID=3040204 RepID=UPI0029C8329E|nr:PIG-L family deacetylase [Pleurocapsa sp. FMAR1]